MKATQWSFKRVEKKYLMTEDQCYRFCEAVRDRIEPDTYPLSTICNIYYDTPDYLLIRRSIEKPVYKEKFRLRSYGVPDDDTPVFMEIKKKFKGIVYKRRVRAGEDESVRYLAGGPRPNANDPQILSEIDWFFRKYDLQPGMFVAYERLAFRSKEDRNLRITFDWDIRYRVEDMDLRKGADGIRLFDENMVIMELKIPGAAPVWLSEILSELNIYPTSFSKYGRCYLKEFGTTTTYEMEGKRYA